MQVIMYTCRIKGFNSNDKLPCVVLYGINGIQKSWETHETDSNVICTDFISM